MFDFLTQRWLGAPSQHRSADQIEEDVRRELAELERQTVAFHEVIGLLRATLSFASSQEHEGHLRLQRIGEAYEEHASDAVAPGLRLSRTLAAGSWRRDRLYAHTLRQLYHRLLEAKRRFLYQWHQHLMRQVLLLPEARQAPMTALLENSLQGILAVGVGQVESQYTEEIDQMYTQIVAPYMADGDAATGSLEEIELLLQRLHDDEAPEVPAAPTEKEDS